MRHETSEEIAVAISAETVVSPKSILSPPLNCYGSTKFSSYAVAVYLRLAFRSNICEQLAKVPFGNTPFLGAVGNNVNPDNLMP
jgi:hypothetical protein